MIISKSHKRTPLKTRVVNRIEDIPFNDWHSVYPDIIESYQFFKTLDRSGLKQFSFYYMMVYDKGKPVGATPFFIMNYSLDTSVNGPLRRITNRIKKAAPNVFSIKTLICGAPLGQGRIGITGDRTKVLEVMLRKMEQLAKKNKASIIAFKDFDKLHTDILDPLQKGGFHKFDSLPNTELSIQFKDFEGYLKTLSGASRYDFRRKLKKVDKDLNMTLEIADAVSGRTLEDVHRLYMQVVDKHDMGFEVMPQEFFKHISVNLPKNTKFFLWRIEGRLAAFDLCLVADDVLMVYYTGLDYTVAYRHNLYFLMFKDILNWCIDHKIKKFEMGYKGYEAKRRLGFDFIPLNIYVKLRNRILRPAFNLICQLLKFENFDPSLKAAKDKIENRPSR